MKEIGLNNYLVGGARHGYWHLRYFFENFSGRYDHGKKVGYWIYYESDVNDNIKKIVYYV